MTSQSVGKHGSVNDVVKPVDFGDMKILPISTVNEGVGNCYTCDDGTGGECDNCDCDSCDSSS